MGHTKGPWEAHNGEVTTAQISGRSYRRIAAVQDYGMGAAPEVDEANARLIAAAPDLLAACQRVKRLAELGTITPIGALAAVDSAIEAATRGRTV